MFSIIVQCCLWWVQNKIQWAWRISLHIFGDIRLYVCCRCNPRPLNMGLHIGSFATKSNTLHSIYEMDDKLSFSSYFPNFTIVKWWQKLCLDLSSLFLVHNGSHNNLPIHTCWNKGQKWSLNSLINSKKTRLYWKILLQMYLVEKSAISNQYPLEQRMKWHLDKIIEKQIYYLIFFLFLFFFWLIYFYNPI